jgi:hypothetical protein
MPLATLPDRGRWPELLFLFSFTYPVSGFMLSSTPDFAYYSWHQTGTASICRSIIVQRGHRRNATVPGGAKLNAVQKYVTRDARLFTPSHPRVDLKSGVE